MAVRGKQAVSTTSTAVFGPQERGECTLQNRGDNIAYITADGTAAVADTGFTLASGESVNTKDLPPEFLWGNFRAICAATESATIYWAQA